MDLNSKVCLVTGCGRGIGKAIAELYCELGAVVYSNARKEGSLDDWANEINSKMKGVVKPIYFDVSDEAAIKQSIMTIRKTDGRLDVLVNNAGVMLDAPMGMISNAMISETFETNVFGPIYLMQFASKLMTRQQAGSIINISSIIGVEGNKNQVLYSASKGALISLTKSAAKELANKGIRVNAIAPGVVDTDLFRQIGSEKAEEFISKVKLGRAAEPREIAYLCAFLASDLSLYITGEVIGIDGCMEV